MIMHTRQRGLVHVWVAIMLTVFVAFLGIAVDMWYTSLSAQQLQVGADAAALAAASYVRDDQDEARARAIAIAAANTAGGDPIALAANSGNAADGDIVIGRYVTETGEFIVTTEEVNAVRVNARRTSGSTGGPLGLFFGPMFGANTADVTRTATAIVGGELRLGALILARIGPCAFEMSGTASSLVINNGALFVNSDNMSAACASGHPTVVADEILIHGSHSTSFGGIKYDREIFTGVQQVDDPLISLPEPTRPLLPGINVSVVGNTTVALVPGYYQDVTMNNGNLILAPGVYYIDGNFRVTGGNLTANNVMIFIGPNGSLDLTGNGEIQITAMNPMIYAAGPAIPAPMRDERVAIFQSRSNTNTASIRGTGDFDLDGRIYMPNNRLDVGGTGKALGTGLIVGTLDIFGDGDMIVDADPFRIPRVEFVYIVE